MKRILIVIAILFAGVGILFLINGSGDSTTDSNDIELEVPPEENITATYIRISARQAKELMRNSYSHVILDVRTEEEFHESHIPNAIL